MVQMKYSSQKALKQRVMEKDQNFFSPISFFFISEIEIASDENMS